MESQYCWNKDHVLAYGFYLSIKNYNIDSWFTSICWKLKLTKKWFEKYCFAWLFTNLALTNFKRYEYRYNSTKTTKYYDWMILKNIKHYIRFVNLVWSKHKLLQIVKTNTFFLNRYKKVERTWVSRSVTVRLTFSRCRFANSINDRFTILSLSGAWSNSVSNASRSTTQKKHESHKYKLTIQM